MHVLERRERSAGTQDLDDVLENLLRHRLRKRRERQTRHDVIDRQQTAIGDDRVELLGRDAHAIDGRPARLNAPAELRIDLEREKVDVRSEPLDDRRR